MEFPSTNGKDLTPEAQRDVPEALVDTGAAEEATDTFAVDPAQAATNDTLAAPNELTGTNTSLEVVAATDGGENDDSTPRGSEPQGQDSEPANTARGGDIPPEDPPTPQDAAGSDDDPGGARLTEYHDTFGNVAVTEMRRIKDGQTETTLLALDTAGADITVPAGYRGFIVEGKDIAKGTLTRVTERDEQGRPLCAIGEDDDINPDESLRRETSFGYNAAGLLETVVESREDGTAKTRYENVFDETGRRTGSIESELVDINSATGEETYDVTQVITYTLRTDGTWHETNYQGYRDGLIPRMAREGVSLQPFSSETTLYKRPGVLPEHLPFELAAGPPETDLEAIDEFNASDPANTMTLPSWIPKAAAREMAAGRVPLEQLAVTPAFPETEGVRVMSQNEAFVTINESTGPEVFDLMNQMAARETVVVQPVDIPRQLLRAIADRASRLGALARGPLTRVQKLGLVAMVHPAFSRKDVVAAPGSLEETRDLNIRNYFFDVLGINTDSAAQEIFKHAESLSPETLRRWRYVLKED